MTGALAPHVPGSSEGSGVLAEGVAVPRNPGVCLDQSLLSGFLPKFKDRFEVLWITLLPRVQRYFSSFTDSLFQYY